MLKKILYLISLLCFGFICSINADVDLLWEKLEVPFDSAYLRCITSTGRYIFVGGSYSVYRYDSQTGQWLNTTGGQIQTVEWIATDGTNKNIYFKGKFRTSPFISRIFKSVDQGLSWDSIGRITSGSSSHGIVRDNGKLIIMTSSDRRVAVSQDSGRTWRISDYSPSLTSACDLIMDKQGIVYVATTNFFGYDELGGVYRSLDTCKTWLPPGPMNSASSLTEISDIGRIVLSTAWGSVYYSDNQGERWVSCGFGADCNHLFTTSGNIVLGSDGSNIWCSFDQGLTWQNNNNGIETSTDKFTEDYNDNVYLIGYSPIVDLYICRSLVGIEQNIVVPKMLTLGNYPNPFNNSTTIKYNLPASGIVKLMVYNTKGEQVEELINKFQNAGSHAIIFNADGLHSGVYYVRITAGKTSTVHKIILIK